jgi:glutamyl/glutaminyl-tRNA synthetase
MISENPTQAESAATNPFSAADVVAILRERGWLVGPPPEETEAWPAEAAALLGPQSVDRDALAGLLRLVFEYHAEQILRSPESHAVLAREGAREVIRELAHLALDGPEVDSDRFKEIVSALKARLHFRGRELFHPLRLALAGRAGEGELDRVILLLDRAARLDFAVKVKGVSQRMLEFCAALE